MSTRPDPVLRPFAEGDIDAALTLWRATPGIGVNDRDTPERLRSYLERNPGCSMVALAEGRVVGSVLAGHDGRRGYLHHLAVADAQRGRGLGRALVDAARANLAALGIDVCHCFVYADNAHGRAFWRALGWSLRDDLVVMTGGKLPP